MTTQTLLNKVLMIEELLNEKQLTALRDMLYVYKELQSEVHNYPPEDTLFTKTQFEIFDIFDIK
jgi:hypothetical protein